MINMEIWKVIQGYETLYEISNYGNVRNNKGKYIKPFKNNKGYLLVRLHKNNSRKIFLLHRLVALHFIPNPNNLPEVNHKDENTLNAHFSNLEWCDRVYNVRYGSGIDRMKETLTGRQLSETHKANISEGHKKEIAQYDLNQILLKVWSSAKDAESETKISRNHICEVCKGKRRTAGGYIWKYSI